MRLCIYIYTYIYSDHLMRRTSVRQSEHAQQRAACRYQHQRASTTARARNNLELKSTPQPMSPRQLKLEGQQGRISHILYIYISADPLWVRACR